MALTDTTEGRIVARLLADKGYDARLPPIVIRLLGLANQVSRYAVVSVLALALDFAVYLAIANAGTKPVLAGVAGYALGMLLHFSLSTRFVFKRKDVAKTETRLFLEFIVSGIVGMIITAGVIAVGTDMLRLSPLLAKVFAVVMSFMAVFVLRKSVVFAKR